jgi:2-methylcitrate dehydratase PrpD
MSESRVPVAVTLARWIAGVRPVALRDSVRRAVADTVIDTLGLALGARNSDYVIALRKSWLDAGPCTLLGATSRRSADAAAMINATAAHGEDFDNTFEGCPVHPGAVIVPAVLGVAEAHELKAADVLRGVAVGQELMCRLGMSAQKAIHAAGFHPTAVTGALGSAAAVASALRLPELETVRALGIAGSMASGIIEYLADGSWTKRMHAGWAAHSGIRAVKMAAAGFTGPPTVFEGEHGFFRAFAPSVSPDVGELTRDLGTEWLSAAVAFKPYASGTMTQPFIDCALALKRQGVRAEDVLKLHCYVGEGTVHRLWEPLEHKRRPPSAYAAKFSTPYCIAIALLRGDAGLAEFGDALISDPEVLALMRRIDYEIDPEDEYPLNYTGRIEAILSDNRIIDLRQPYLRGGVREPLPRRELLSKCAANLAYGHVDPRLVEHVESLADGIAQGSAAASVSLERLAIPA